jgi:hypothetical protein
VPDGQLHLPRDCMKDCGIGSTGSQRHCDGVYQAIQLMLGRLLLVRDMTSNVQDPTRSTTTGSIPAYRRVEWSWCL